MIERISKDSLDEVLPLIRNYQEFYKVADICDIRNKEFFSKFCNSNPAGCQFLYREGSEVVGFATVYFSFTSTITAKAAILNDLYTVPTMRGKRIGKKLIEHCREFAAKNNAARLKWVTAPNNHTAHKLYDSLNATKSEWIFYTYNT
jgi:GNAT superfamily N-acetyltransferase